MRILVTGSAGFIGSYVTEFFSRENQVIVCDNLSRNETIGRSVGSETDNWRFLEEKNSAIELHKTDVRDFNELKEVAQSPDAIIHTAGQVAVTTSLVNPRIDFETNALGTFNVLEVARLHDSSLIFCSTNKVYGENVNAIRVKELDKRYEFDDPAFTRGIPENFSVDRTGHSPYGSSKLAADIYVQDYAHTYGLKTAVFR